LLQASNLAYIATHQILDRSSLSRSRTANSADVRFRNPWAFAKPQMTNRNHYGPQRNWPQSLRALGWIAYCLALSVALLWLALLVFW